MKTILIAHNYTVNTVAAMSYYLATYLAEDNYKVIFITHKQAECVAGKNITLLSWPSKNRPTTLKDAIWFAQVYFKYKPDVIISHFASVNITVLVSKVLSFGRVKTFPYYHTLSTQLNLDSQGRSMLQKVKKIRKYFLYKYFCDGIICPSELAVHDLKNCFKINKGIKVLNPMIDRYKTANEIHKTDRKISFLGRLNLSKGVFELINAFNEYCEKYPETKLILQIAGSGNEENQLKSLSEENEKINFIGSLKYEEIDKYLKSSYYTIIPSLSDNLPTVGLESMMNNTPILISTNTGLASELEQGVNCFKFNPNKSDLKELFLKLEIEDFNYDKLQENSRSTYLEKFSLPIYCKNIESLILSE